MINLLIFSECCWKNWSKQEQTSPRGGFITCNLTLLRWRKFMDLTVSPELPARTGKREGARSTCDCEALQAAFTCSEHKICMRVVAYKSCRSSCLASLRLQCNSTSQFYFYASISDKTRMLSWTTWVCLSTGRYLSYPTSFPFLFELRHTSAIRI